MDIYFCALKVTVMKAIPVLSFLLGLVFLVSCKNENTTPGAEGSTAQAVTAAPASAGEQPAAASAPNAGGDPEGHDYTFLTHQLFHITGAFVPGKDPSEKPYDGEWIDLDQSGMYRYGKHQKQTYTGQWSYNHDVQTLSLRPDDPGVKPTEWKVMFNDQMMVWVGTKTFGNNGTQLRLVRFADIPR